MALILLCLIGTSTESPNDSGGDSLFADEATRQCQQTCVNTPVLLECDKWCMFRYDDEHNQDTCLRYCTRSILMCLHGCANLEKRKKHQELLDRLGLSYK